MMDTFERIEQLQREIERLEDEQAAINATYNERISARLFQMQSLAGSDAEGFKVYNTVRANARRKDTDMEEDTVLTQSDRPQLLQNANGALRNNQCSGCSTLLPASHHELPRHIAVWHLVPGLGWTCGDCLYRLAPIDVKGRVETVQG